jgi:hypothetical protein
MTLVMLSTASIAAKPASKNETLKMSSTFSISWPRTLGLQTDFVPNYRGFWLEGKHNGKSYSVWISRSEPETIANKFSVERYWREGTQFEKSIGTNAVDLGCKEIQPHSFRCDNTAHQQKSKRFAAQSMFWNSKSDLVVVRVTSSESVESARALLNELHFDITNRLPAGGAR